MAFTNEYLALPGNPAKQLLLKRMTSDVSEASGSRLVNNRSSLRGSRGMHSSTSLRAQEENKPMPVRLVEKEVKRPDDEGMDKQDIEFLIEKKRTRVTTNARLKAEKAKLQTNIFGVGAIPRKGGIPSVKLRGLHEADFF